MTKKDYILFANSIKYTNNIPMKLQELGLQNTPENVKEYKTELKVFCSGIFRRDNYRFSIVRFSDYINSINSEL